jgi:hypothetical protein
MNIISTTLKKSKIYNNLSTKADHKYPIKWESNNYEKITEKNKQWESTLATDSEQIVKAEKDQHPHDIHKHPDKHIPSLIDQKKEEKATNTIRHIQDNQIQYQININNEFEKKLKNTTEKYYKQQYEDFIDDEF